MGLFSKVKDRFEGARAVRVRGGGIALIDKAIGVFAPERALQRVRAKIALRAVDQILQKENFSYDGASAGRRTHGWYAPSSDASVEAMGSLVWLRNRSRELIRNNPYAAKAVDELVGNTVGTGIVPQAKTGDENLDKIIDTEWPFFAEKCDTPQRLDFYGMQALIMRTTAESGEAIVRFRPRLAKDNLRVPLQLQILEADFLDHARTMGTVNGHVLQGVEFDMIGQRVAYWLYTQHPGGVLILNPRGGIISQRVPEDQVLHSYRVLRPGQVRGIPWLHPVMIAMRDLDDYRDAERVRKKIEACVVAMVTQPEGNAGQPLGIPAKDPYTRQPVETFEPAMVEYLKPGQDVKFNNPPPTGGYREYLMTELEGIAAGIGMPFELMTGNMEKVNFSSWRGGMLSFRNTIENYRWLTLIPMQSMPARKRFIDTLILIGKIPTKAINDPSINIYGTEWTAPRFENVDPVKDADGVLKQIRMGTMNWFEAVAANGYDPRKQLDQIQLFNKLVDKFGIILDCDPRNMTLKGQGQPTTSEEIEPTAPSGKARDATADKVKPATIKAAMLSDEDFGMIRELLIAGAKDVNRRWDSPTRMYVS